MELLGLVVIILLYVIILYFINKNKATELIKDLMRYAQISINGGEIKKTEWEVGANYVHKIK